MTPIKALIPALALAAAATGIATAAAGGADEGAAIQGTWQHHKVSFTYSGFTAAYTCSGLEDRLRSMLRSLGARRDITVRAGACPGGPDTPTHMILVDLDFYSLAPVGEATAQEQDSKAGATVMGHWAPMKMAPHSSGSGGDGDCELIQGMKDIITKNFAVRDIKYRTDCFPHQITLGSYEVSGQILKPASAAKS